MGKRAVDLLISHLNNPEHPGEKIVVPTQLMINETGKGGPPPAND
jgi:DNA-binding LacI/PurR family transcriptional regulator